MSTSVMVAYLFLVGYIWVNLLQQDFLMSNLEVTVHGRQYKGLAIKIIDGLLVTADGRFIRHGTTSSIFDGSIFGYQFALNGISMSSKI